MRSVTAVVVTYNRLDVLDQCLESVFRQTAGAIPVVLVDNGSTVDSTAQVRAAHPEVQLIRIEKNIGFIRACNLGIKAALRETACEYVVLLNDDAWIAEDWVATILAFAERRPKGACFQGLTLDGHHTETVDSFGLFINHAGQAGQMGYRQNQPAPASGEVFGVNGAAALYRRSFLETQPFGDEYLDSDLFMYLEDVDLAARAVVMGWRNYFVREALAYHLGSGGGREFRPLPLRMCARNGPLVMVKNLPWRVIAKMSVPFARAEVSRTWSLVRAGEYAKAAAVARGHWQTLPRLPTFLRKRRVLAARWDVDSERLWELMAGRVLEGADVQTTTEESAPSPRTDPLVGG